LKARRTISALRRGPRAGLILLLAAGCSPTRSGDGLGSEELCEPLELVEGEVRVKRVACSDEVPSTGDGRTGDYLLQNARASVIIRSPYESMTLLDLPGGTVLDFIHVDDYDTIFEAVPLIDGGWMAPESLEIGVEGDVAWLTLTGTTLPVSFLGGSEGQPAEITYRLAADSDVLEIEGGGDLYLQARTSAQLIDEHFVRFDTRLQPLSGGELAPLVDDLGGAVIYQGVDGIHSGPFVDVYPDWWPDGDRVSGTCDGNDVMVYAGDTIVAWLEAEFDAVVPPGAEALVCVKKGYADGERTPPGRDLALTLGEETALLVRVADHQGVDIPAVVDWVDSQAAVPPGGGEVYPGVGTFEVTVHHGARTDPWTGTVEVPEGGARLDVVLERRLDTEGWIAADLFRDAWPSRTSREFPPDDLTLAAGQGFSYAVESPPDEVAQPYTNDSDERWLDRAIRYQAGSHAATDHAGRVWSWPWSENRKWSGHGAISWEGLPPEDILALASDGLEPYRYNIVDADWLASAGPPHQWNPPPMLIRLDGADEVPALLEVFDAGVFPGLTGPVTWTPAETGSLPSAAACERGIITGQSVASSGPLLALSAEPSLWVGEWVHPFSLRLQSNDAAALALLELYVDGEVVGSWALTGRGGEFNAALTLPGEGYAVAVASGAGWAVSAPILLENRGGNVPH